MPNPDFELRLIRIFWSGQRMPDPSQTFISNVTIPMRKDGSDYIVSITTHSRFWHEQKSYIGQIAVGLTEEASERSPQDASIQDVSFHYEEGKSDGARQLTDASGREWYVEAGRWDKERKYYDTQSVTTAGAFTILIGAKKITVLIQPTAFNEGQYEALLEDFQSGLIGLITRSA